MPVVSVSQNQVLDGTPEGLLKRDLDSDRTSLHIHAPLKHLQVDPSLLDAVLAPNQQSHGRLLAASQQPA